jgi:hypothetical protein
MSTTPPQDWVQENQRALNAQLARVRAALVRHAKRIESRADSSADMHMEIAPSQNADLTRTEADTEEGRGSATLERACAAFALSPFERDVLLLCAGMELDYAFAAHCVAASGDSRKPYPTFSLALAALPEAHWSALLPVAPLRRWRLIELGSDGPITTSPLRIDERILHFLTGLSYLDERLHGLLEPCFVSAAPPSHARIATRVVELWRAQAGWFALQLAGQDAEAKRTIAATACAAMGVQLLALRAGDIPAGVAEREAFLRLWERETILRGCALLIDCAGFEQPESQALHVLIERAPGPVMLSVREPLRDGGARALLSLEVSKLEAAEQVAIWREVLGPAGDSLNGQVEAAAAHFNLNVNGIHTAVAEFNQRLNSADANAAGTMLWDLCRFHSRRGLDGLAQRIEPVATWDDLVLPEPQRQTLRQMVLHVRQRTTVYERWGFAKKSARGLGVSALFFGASGTGKTTAAEVLANELRLDLYRIDLSAVVSKYIGETEKISRGFLTVRTAAGRFSSSTRPTHSTANAAKSRTVTTAMQTSRSVTCCSGWSRIADSPFSRRT